MPDELAAGFEDCGDVHIAFGRNLLLIDFAELVLFLAQRFDPFRCADQLQASDILVQRQLIQQAVEQDRFFGIAALEKRDAATARSNWPAAGRPSTQTVREMRLGHTKVGVLLDSFSELWNLSHRSIISTRRSHPAQPGRVVAGTASFRAGRS